MTAEPHKTAADEGRIRPGRDDDGPALIALIWSCWSAYPGIRMDVAREMPELHALASYYGGQGGALWVAEIGDVIVGMIATRPLRGAEWEICRVYVDPARHGSRLGHALLDVAEGHAVAAGAQRLALWSDTRFGRAHRFYEKRCYVRHGPVRVLTDISNSLEFGYAKPVDGIETLDIAAAASAGRRLADILVACVDQGASVGFLRPLAADRARAFWQRVASEVGGGTRVLVAAWRGGVLVGTGMLELMAAETQPHRADLQQILVDPGTRRSGLGRQILRALAQAAGERGRTLLTSETRAGEGGEQLYRAEGWHEAGRIAGFTRDRDGIEHASLFFWKQLGR